MTGSNTWNRERLIGAGRAVVDRYAGAAYAFVSGSLVEGFGNETSDVDVFLVGDGVTLRGEGGHSVAYDGYTVDIDVVDDVRTDVEIWSATAVRDALAEIAACGSDDWKAVIRLDRARVEFAHRLRIGLPVAGAAEFESVRDSVDWGHLSDVLAQRFLSMYNGHLDDTIGAVKAGDACAAMLNSRLTLGAAVDALAAAAGATNASAKWRHHRLAAHVSPEVVRRYLDTEIDISSAPADLLRSARRRLVLASEFASEATTRLLTQGAAGTNTAGASGAAR